MGLKIKSTQNLSSNIDSNNLQTTISPPSKPSSLSLLGSRQISEVNKDVDINKNSNFKNIVHIVKIEDGNLIFSPITDMNLEQAKNALSQDTLGIIQENESGITIKFSANKTKQLESVGISSVQLVGSQGVQTYKSFNFKSLSDNELNLLILNVKSHISYLKTISGDDNKTKKTIDSFELQLRYLYIEKASRLENKSELIELIIDLVDTQSYKTAIKLAQNLRQSIEEKEVEKSERKLENLKCEILKKEIFSHETFITLVEGTLLKNEENKIVDDEGKNRVLLDVGYFINLHKNLTKKDVGK